jgi:hypothetical protein
MYVKEFNIMPELVQVELNPEYLKFPNRCVCCARPDERNMDMAIGSTDPAEHEQDIIMAVELPYCLECYQHANAPSNLLRIIAVAVALSLLSFSSLSFGLHLNMFIVIGFAALFAGYIAWEVVQSRRFMHPSCSSRKGHVIFGNPTNSRTSTIIFSNELVADSFKELNRYNVVEL